jgi:hypothetical protein
MNMGKIFVILALAATLIACESLYEVSDIADIRSQRQVDAYNSTVAAEEDKLVCTRERPLGSNIPRFVCMTVAQQSRLEARARDELQLIR